MELTLSEMSRVSHDVLGYPCIARHRLPGVVGLSHWIVKISTFDVLYYPAICRRVNKLNKDKFEGKDAVISQDLTGITLADIKMSGVMIQFIPSSHIGMLIGKCTRISALSSPYKGSETGESGGIIGEHTLPSQDSHKADAQNPVCPLQQCFVSQ